MFSYVYDLFLSGSHVLCSFVISVFVVCILSALMGEDKKLNKLPDGSDCLWAKTVPCSSEQGLAQ